MPGVAVAGHGLSVGTLAELAAWLGHARYLERRCFELQGGWVADTPEPAVKATLAEQCYHHAWHAEVWEARFPAGYGHDLDVATVPASDGLADALAALADAPGTLERLLGFHRVLQPRKIAAYDHLRADANPVSDGPVLRWLDLVVADEVADWRRGEAAVQQLLLERRDEQDRSSAWAWVSDLEDRFITAGDVVVGKYRG